MQVVNVFMCRSATRSILAKGLRGNALIILGVPFEIAILLLIDFAPWVNWVLGTAAIGEEVWVFIIPFAASVLVLEELRKWPSRRRLLDEASPNGAGAND